MAIGNAIERVFRRTGARQDRDNADLFIDTF